MAGHEPAPHPSHRQLEEFRSLPATGRNRAERAPYQPQGPNGARTRKRGCDFAFATAGYLTGLVIVLAAALAYVTTRDTLHPMIYLGGMALFLHAFMPLYLEMTQADELRGYLDQDELDYAQTIVLLGTVSLCGGVWWGAHRAPAYFHMPPLPLASAVRVRLVRAGVALAALGLIAWIHQIINAGGLHAVYGQPYGWFLAENGYVYEAFQFGLPGALLLLLARRGLRLRPWDLVWISIALLPLLGHGLLGARRGPTFMALVGVAVMWYLVRARRPRLGAAVLGGLAIGLLLLFLLANRDRIYLGAELEFTGLGETHAFEVEPGNEFVFGAGAALNAEALDAFMWGRRYFVVLFVRPIPRALWPTKYADAAHFLNIPNLDHVDKDPQLTDFAGTIGWRGAIGSAPGGLFDLWIEFRWAYLFALFATGWGFGCVYRRAVSQGGFWMALYALTTALSIYFVMQALEAFAFRALLLGAVTWLGWRYAIGGGVPARTHGTSPQRSPLALHVVPRSAGRSPCGKPMLASRGRGCWSRLGRWGAMSAREIRGWRDVGPLRVLVIADAKIPVPPAGYGGTERIVALLCAGLAARGHQVTLMAAKGSRDYGRLITHPWAGCKPYPYRAWCKLRFQAQSLWQARHANVVINFGRVDYLRALLHTTKPLICQFQNPVPLSETDFLLSRRREALSLVSASDHQRAHLAGAGSWRTIYNAVDTDGLAFAPRPDPGYLAFLGRLTENKGVHTAIEVARQLGRPLRIAGNVSDEPGGRQFFETRVRPQLGDGIEWVGPVDDEAKVPFLQDAAALLMPIQWDEPFGLVVAEALACGTPVLATPRGAMPELIRHGVTGFLCRSTDEMIDAGGRVAEIDRRACRADCERRFSADRMVEQYLTVIRSVMRREARAQDATFSSGTRLQQRTGGLGS